MTVPVQSKSVIITGTTTGVLALNSAATIGNTIILTVCWADNGSSTQQTLPVPADANGTWSVAVNPASSIISGQIPNGSAIFYEQVVSATTHSSTVSTPSGGANDLFALITISEWPAATLDKVQSNLNDSASGSTATNSGTTAILTSATDFAVACTCINSSVGLSNAGISDPATGYTASLGVSQNTSATVGAEASYLSLVSSTAGQIANWTNTADGNEGSWQAAIATFTPSAVTVSNVIAWWT